MSSNAEVEAAQSITAQRVSSTLQKAKAQAAVVRKLIKTSQMPPFPFSHQPRGSPLPCFLTPRPGRALLTRHWQYYLENNARRLVEVHHLVNNWLEKVLVTWERAKDGYLAPQGDGETGNKRKKGVERACSPGKGQAKESNHWF